MVALQRISEIHVLPPLPFIYISICYKPQRTRIPYKPDLNKTLAATLLPPALIKSTLAANPLPFAFADKGLKAFQEADFTAAYVGQLQGSGRMQTPASLPTG